MFYNSSSDLTIRLVMTLILNVFSVIVFMMNVFSVIQVNDTVVQDKKSSYEEMFPVYAQPFAVPEPVDLFDQSWRRVARDNWPYLFSYYNITITGRLV